MNAETIPPFVPHRLLRGGHRQTIASIYLPSQGAPYRPEQHVIDLDDGDKTVLHDDCPEGWQSGDRVALLLHGVAGCHGSPYVLRTAYKLNQAGVRTFRMDLRGFGAGTHLARLPGHAGRSEDAASAIMAIHDLEPNSPVTMVGFSMGGNIALKLLGELGNTSLGRVDNAIVVSPPADLVRCAANIQRGFNRHVYNRDFTKRLVRLVREKQRTFPEFQALLPRLTPRDIVEFDEQITAPLSGFASADDYYRRSSAANVLSSITRQVVIITAEDDPIIPIETLREQRLSSSVELITPSHGGHVGFIAARGGDPDRWWIDWRVVDFCTGSPPPTVDSAESELAAQR